MDKRYQVFLSSTYADLQDERSAVIQALMEMDCIPAGMELFPAADEAQWEFIKKVIDDCDYYLVIVGGRYGSLTSEGISYTEKEYEYAESSGVPILAFIHNRPNQLTVAKSDISPSLRESVELFRKRVGTGRLVKFWDDPRALPGVVALSLQKAIKTYPRIGWVRASALPGTEALLELNDVRKRNEALGAELTALRAREVQHQPMSDLAPLDAEVIVWGTYHGDSVGEPWRVTTTWRHLFALLAPYLLERPNDTSVKLRLDASLFAMTGLRSWSQIKPRLDDQLFQTIKIQLMAHGLVKVDYLATTKGGMALFWSLSDTGHAALMQLRAVRENQPSRAREPNAR